MDSYSGVHRADLHMLEGKEVRVKKVNYIHTNSM